MTYWYIFLQVFSNIDFCKSSHILVQFCCSQSMVGRLISLVSDLKSLLLKQHAENHSKFGHADLSMSDIMHQQKSMGFRLDDFISDFTVSAYNHIITNINICILTSIFDSWQDHRFGVFKAKKPTFNSSLLENIEDGKKTFRNLSSEFKVIPLIYDSIIFLIRSY